MNQYFSKSKSFGANVKVELDSSNYATKADFKYGTSVDTLTFPKKIDVANLKSEVDILDVDKLEKVPTGLKNKVDKVDVDKLVPAPVDLNDVVKNDVVKATQYNELVKKEN